MASSQATLTPHEFDTPLRCVRWRTVRKRRITQDAAIGVRHRAHRQRPLIESEGTVNAAVAVSTGRTRADWERRLLLGLLWPVLWLQARCVRRITPRMPEPPGCRAGTAGRGSLVRLLVAGDSGAAGVGASTQDQALCGQLVRRLSQHILATQARSAFGPA